MSDEPQVIQEIKRQAADSLHLQHSLVYGVGAEGGRFDPPWAPGDNGWSRGPLQIKYWDPGRHPTFNGHPLTIEEAEDPAVAIAYAIKWERGRLPNGQWATIGLGYRKNSLVESDPLLVAQISEQPAHPYSAEQRARGDAAIARYFKDTTPMDIVIPKPDWAFVGAHPNNYIVGRGSVSPEAVVWHIAEGAFDPIMWWFLDPRAEASTRFSIAKDGRIREHVSRANTAFGHGRVEVEYDAARQLIRDNWGINPNLWADGIEFEGTAAEARAGLVPTPAQRVAAVRLTAYLFSQELYDPAAGARPPADRDHILRHEDISPKSRTCPAWPEATQLAMIGEVQALLQPPIIVTPPPEPQPEPTPQPEPGPVPPMDNEWLLRTGLAYCFADGARDLADGTLTGSEALFFARQNAAEIVATIDKAGGK